MSQTGRSLGCVLTPTKPGSLMPASVGSPAVLQQGHLPGDRGGEGDTPATTWTVPASSAREQVGPRP